jgi:hypothetical protein
MSISTKTQIVAGVAVVGLVATGAAVASAKLHHSHLAAGSGLMPGYVGSSARGWSGRPPGFERHGGDLEAAASYLGLSAQALQDQLRAGKTLAQIADATSGKSAAGLIDALVKQEQDKLAAAVKDGSLTQAQADFLSSNLKSRITDRVNGTLHGPGRGGPGFRPDAPRI